MFAAISPTPREIAASLPGDTIIPIADVVMDRAFTLKASPEKVWPWFVQLGKNRAGWYLPRWVEILIPPSKRALRHIEPKLQDLSVGDIIDDWGGRKATFKIAAFEPNRFIVHESKRGSMPISWVIYLSELDKNTSHVQLRLRLGNVKHLWLAKSAGELIDILTVAGLRAGLKERVSD